MSDKENNIVEMKQEPKAKPYTLRKLDGEDLWLVLEIVGKVLPDDLAPLFMEIATGGKDVSEVGGVVMVRLISTIIKDISKVKNEVYTFLEGVSGLKREEINSLGLLAVPRMIWDIYNAEKDFFAQ